MAEVSHKILQTSKISTVTVNLGITTTFNGHSHGDKMYILNFGATDIPLESLKLDTSNFVCRLTLKSTISYMKD